MEHVEVIVLVLKYKQKRTTGPLAISGRSEGIRADGKVLPGRGEDLYAPCARRDKKEKPRLKSRPLLKSNILLKA